MNADSSLNKMPMDGDSRPSPCDAAVESAVRPTRNEASPRFDPAIGEMTELIGVDWGTTNVRVMRIGFDGQVLELRQDDRGAAKLRSHEFSAVLEEIGGDWLRSDTPILICGMAGSRDGWLEAGYVPCPVSLANLVPVTVPFAGGIASIVPGVSRFEEDVLADVMRGEETQVMGLDECDQDGIIVTPGTHSKWIKCERGAIVSFRSFLTGDLFAAIKAETLLGHEMGNAGGDDEAFARGVRRALDDSALTAILFSVRTAKLSGQIPARSTADYLSGLLIGAEIAAQAVDQARGIIVLGASDLCKRYAAALAIAGAPKIEVRDATEFTAKGLWRINRRQR